MSKEKCCPTEYRFFFNSLGLIDLYLGTNHKNLYAVLLDNSQKGNINWGNIPGLFSETPDEDEASKQHVRKRHQSNVTSKVAINRIYSVIEKLAMNTEDVRISPSAINSMAKDAEETGKFLLVRHEKKDDQLENSNSPEMWIEIAKKLKDLANRCLTQNRRTYMKDKALREQMNEPVPPWIVKILIFLLILIPILVVFVPRRW